MSDTDSNKGRGSPESVADSAAADQQATEIEQLKKQLEEANLQIRDKDNWLAAADADHHNLQEQVAAALQDRDRQLAEAAQATDNARHVLPELNQTQQQLQHMQQERDTVHFLQERAQIRQQHGPPPTSAFSPVPDQRPVDTDQTAVLEVVDQWNRHQQPPARSPAVNQHHQHRSSPTYNWSGLSHSGARPATPLRHHAQSHFAGRDGASSRSSTSSPGGYSVPLPRQMTCDGKTSWQSFILPFKSLAAACRWSEEEKLFCLTNSLRDDAAEHTFAQLSSDVVNSFELLELALDAHFAEKRTAASYLASLEARKLQPKEKLSEYVADIKKLVIKGYPTADQQTRETIGLRYFLKGLPESQMAVAVGMKSPETLEEARTILDTYNSLREETKPARIRAAQPAGDKHVTESRLQEFGKELKSGFDSQFQALKDLLQQKPNSDPQGRLPRSRSPSPRPRCVSFSEAVL